MGVAREISMSLSSVLLRGIAGWMFAIRNRTEWLSLTIRTFLFDSFVWIIKCAGRNGITLVVGRITKVTKMPAPTISVLHRTIRVDGKVVCAPVLGKDL